MTPEQAARCDALAKRIAELDPNWPKPGMQARGDDGLRRRYVGNCVWQSSDHRGLSGRFANTPSVGRDDITEAVCAGPDWRCDATLGAILLSLGNIDMFRVFSSAHQTLWHVGAGVLTWDEAQQLPETRAEAILAAKVAQLTQEAK